MPKHLNYKHLFTTKEEALAEVIRVNHAGELAAKQIYIGQLKVLPEDEEILEMLEGELVHLDYFEKAIKTLDIRPSLLNPVWNKCTFLMGFVSAKLGRGTAMLCTEKVEEVIERHYADQIQNMEEGTLKNTLIKFREEEIGHMKASQEASSQNKTLGAIFTLITKFGIKISKKI